MIRWRLIYYYNTNLYSIGVLLLLNRQLYALSSHLLLNRIYRWPFVAQSGSFKSKQNDCSQNCLSTAVYSWEKNKLYFYIEYFIYSIRISISFVIPYFPHFDSYIHLTNSYCRIPYIHRRFCHKPADTLVCKLLYNSYFLCRIENVLDNEQLENRFQNFQFKCFFDLSLQKKRRKLTKEHCTKL